MLWRIVKNDLEFNLPLAGATLHSSNAKVNALMRRLGQELNLKPHWVFPLEQFDE